MTEHYFFQIKTIALNDDKIKLQKESLNLMERKRNFGIDNGVEPNS